MLADRRPALDPPPTQDETLHDVLEPRSKRRGPAGGERLRKMLQMLWADELLEAQRQVQADLAAEADRFVRQSGHRLLI